MGKINDMHTLAKLDLLSGKTVDKCEFQHNEREFRIYFTDGAIVSIECEDWDVLLANVEGVELE